MNKSLALLLVPLFVLLAELLPAPTFASPSAQIGGVQVNISNPTNGMTFAAGQTIGIASTSTAAGGIAYAQLLVDNVPVTSSSPQNGIPQPTFFVIQYWTTTYGSHTITVRATSSQGVTGQTSIYINVGGSPPIGPTRTPNPCVVGARFIADGSVPDGTVFPAGTPFQKTWQIQNTGSCIWINTYGILNIGGGSLGASSPSPIPNTAPGQTVNITVNMVAPQSPGQYTSYWQLRAANGALFGPQVHAQIIVQPTGCNGNPQITSFYASPQNIRVGQSTTLVWGPVYNSDQTKLQTPAGSSPVNAPGQLVLAPQVTTTYIFTAFCQAQRVDTVAQVNVSSPFPPTPTPPPPQQNFITLQRAQAAGYGAINVPVQYFYNNQGAPGQVQLSAYNNFGQVVGSSTVGAIPFSQQYTTVTISIPSGYQNAVSVQGCLTDRTGSPLACNIGRGAVP